MKNLNECIDEFKANGCKLDVYQWLLGYIDVKSSAYVQEVKHGKWIRSANTWTHDLHEASKPIYRCSVCGRYEKIEEPFCNCGAKMDGMGKRNEHID